MYRMTPSEWGLWFRFVRWAVISGLFITLVFLKPDEGLAKVAAGMSLFATGFSFLCALQGPMYVDYKTGRILSEDEALNYIERRKK